MSVEGLSERIGKVETILDNHEHRIRKQESNNELLIEMKTILKNQTETNIQQTKQMGEFSKTLNQINLNLTNLNTSQAQLKEDISKVGSRVSHIEETQEDSKINVPNLMSKIIIGILMIIPTLISGWIMMKTGLK